VVFTYILMGMMIPMHAALYPLTEILLTLTKTHWALIIPYVAFNIPITILILSGFIANIPYEMEEAACIDGSGIYRTAFTIILPMMVPALITAAIFVFLQVWNELLLASLFTTDSVRTLTVGIKQMSGQYQTDYGSMGAGLVIATLPTLVLYMCMSGQVQKSLIAGAVKG
jgi:raffinose/stachyose/melibiose transport system permease protein